MCVSVGGWLGARGMLGACVGLSMGVGGFGFDGKLSASSLKVDVHCGSVFSLYCAKPELNLVRGTTKVGARGGKVGIERERNRRKRMNEYEVR